MNNLQIEETQMRLNGLHLQNNPKQIGDNGMKTPRRGLGMIVNELRTPAKTCGPILLKSTTKNNAEAFSVFEDYAEQDTTTPIEEFQLAPKKCEKESEKQEERLEKIEDEYVLKQLNVEQWDEIPVIEGISRLPTSDLEYISAPGGEETDSTPLYDDLVDRRFDMEIEEEDSVEQLNLEHWDEYPPIEIASRMENVDSFIDCESEDVKLHDDSLPQFFSDEYVSFGFIPRVSSAEFETWAEQDDESATIEI